MSEQKSTIGFRAPASVLNIIKNLKTMIGVDSDSDVIRIAIEELNNRQELHALQTDPVGVINRLYQAQLAGAYASKAEIEYVLGCCYMANYEGMSPVRKESLVLLLNAFRAIASFSAQSYGYHLGCLSCGNNRNIVSCIDEHIKKLPDVEFLHNGHSVALRVIGNFQGILDDVDVVDLNQALEPYWEHILSTAKRYVSIKNKITFDHHINQADNQSESSYFEISHNDLTIECRQYKNDKSIYRIVGIAEGLSLFYDYLEIENLWKQMLYAQANEVHDFKGGVFTSFDSSGKGIACRLHPSSNGVVVIELSHEKTVDLIAVLNMLMKNQHDNEGLKELIQNERIAHGYI